ncbi:MAG TPA: hypothetical protein VF765_03340 [Polyangiaceae bacterium]
MGIPRSGDLIVTQQLLDQHGPDLYERFVQLAEKYQYRDLARAVADAIRVWVETHERPDTGRPPENPDATIQAPPPSVDDLDRDPSSGDK